MDKRTKIVGTLGPASADQQTIEAMIAAGMDVARLNFSHGSHEDHAQLLATLRAAAKAQSRSVGVLLDLCGPKIRVGKMPGGAVELKADQTVVFVVGGQLGALGVGELPVDYEGLARDVKPGDTILFDDGNLEAEVVAVEGERVTTRVVVGGQLKSRKGMNLPGVSVSAPSVTPKDLADLDWGIAHGVDFVALSFVRRVADLGPVKQRLAGLLNPPLVIAKLETPEAAENAESILAACDGIMIARGDLGVELPFEQVPVAQKRLIALANEADKPVITATQMLESMVVNSRPTRAETSDVANAVLDGTDAVMLSGETASGNHPVAAVRSMARIIRATEEAVLQRDGDYAVHRRDAATSSLHDALALGAERMGRAVGAKLIVGATQGLSTVAALASARPSMPILGMTADHEALGRMALLWGVEPVWVPAFEDTGDALAHAQQVVAKRGKVAPGEFIVLAVGRGPSAEFSARVHLYQMPRAAADVAADPERVAPAHRPSSPPGGWHAAPASW